VLQRIHIIGGPGSGKSYAALQLSRLLGIPAYDLDVLFWDRAAPRYGVRAPAAERDARLAAITREATWVIEGVYYGWLGPSFERADRIFVLRPHVLLRDWRIVKRFVFRKCGIRPTKREDLLGLYRLIRWNHQYEANNLRQALEWLREFEDKIIACRGAADLLRYVTRETPNYPVPDEQATGTEHRSEQS